MLKLARQEICGSDDLKRSIYREDLRLGVVAGCHMLKNFSEETSRY
jgi:hypothetical protein